MKEGLPLGPTVQKVDTVRREFGAFRFSTPHSHQGPLWGLFSIRKSMKKVVEAAFLVQIQLISDGFWASQAHPAASFARKDTQIATRLHATALMAL